MRLRLLLSCVSLIAQLLLPPELAPVRAVKPFAPAMAPAVEDETPRVAAGPVQPKYAVAVDLVVVNYVRTLDRSYDAWGRVIETPHVQVWVSFWDFLEVPTFGLIPVNVPAFLVARGWWTISMVRGVAPSNYGWIVESNDNIIVTTRSLVLLTSRYDWERKNARIAIRFVKKE